MKKRLSRVNMPHVTVFIANMTPVPAGAGRYAQGALVPTFFSFIVFFVQNCYHIGSV